MNRFILGVVSPGSAESVLHESIHTGRLMSHRLIVVAFSIETSY